MACWENAMNSERLLDTSFAYGRTAEVFAWPDDRVLKLFRSGWSEVGAHYEADKAQAVYATGLPAPAACDVFQVNGRFGILYERISGIALTKVLQQKPWTLVSMARLLADLHLEMHQHRLPQLPSLRETLTGRIQGNADIPSEIRQVLLQTVAAQPDGRALCHGDFHPENILITDRGPVVLNWMDATRGNPLGDVARTTLLLHHMKAHLRLVRPVSDLERTAHMYCEGPGFHIGGRFEDHNGYRMVLQQAP
jgi:thiamine kinase